MNTLRITIVVLMVASCQAAQFKMAKRRSIPPAPPSPAGLTIASMSEMPARTMTAQTVEPKVIVVPPGVPYIKPPKVQIDPEFGIKEFYFEVGGLVDNHSYIIERTSNFKDWMFSSGWVQGGNEGCCFPFTWPMFEGKLQFRVVDQGTNQPPAPAR